MNLKAKWIRYTAIGIWALYCIPAAVFAGPVTQIYLMVTTP